jgi:hypothetical protein
MTPEWMRHALVRSLQCGAIVLALCGCGFSSRQDLVGPSDNLQEALERQLASELTRLGKDPSKISSLAPTGNDNAAFDLRARLLDANGSPLLPGEPGAAAVQLTWTERLIGDYDQNGVVNITDLTALGQSWKAHIKYEPAAAHNGFANWPFGDPDDSGPGAANWRLARIDGDGGVDLSTNEGEVSIYDVTPLAQHWHEQLAGYRIERGVNRGAGLIEWETESIDLGQGNSPTIARPTILADQPVRYRAAVPLSEPQYAHYYRVRAYDTDTGEQSVASNTAIAYPSTLEDVTPPVWEAAVGVTALQPWTEEVTVQFGTALDQQSPPVLYRVYWETLTTPNTEPLDYASAQVAEVSTGPFTIPGLTDGEYVKVGVRARDSAPITNVEQNTVVFTTKIGAHDVYPPEWSSTAGIVDLYYGNGEAVVVWNSAYDSHTDELQTWASEPVTYRVYYGPGILPDLTQAQFVDQLDLGLETYVLPLHGLDTTRDSWFLVRALDGAMPPNMESNSVFRVGRASAYSMQNGFPASGPNVPQTAQLHGTPLYAFNTDRTTAELCLWFQTDSEVWFSVYRIGADGFTHRADLKVATLTSAPQFDPKAVALDNQGKLQLFFMAQSQFQGPTVVGEYRELSDNTEYHSLTSGPNLESADYGPDGELHGFWKEWTNSDILNPQYATYYSNLPYVMDTLVMATGEPPDDNDIFLSTKPWVWLNDGSLVLWAVLNNRSSQTPTQSGLSISPDGSIAFLPLPAVSSNPEVRQRNFVGFKVSEAVFAQKDYYLSGRGDLRLIDSTHEVYHGDPPGFLQENVVFSQIGANLLPFTDWENYAFLQHLRTEFCTETHPDPYSMKALYSLSNGQLRKLPIPMDETVLSAIPILLPDNRVLCSGRDALTGEDIVIIISL